MYRFYTRKVLFLFTLLLLAIPYTWSQAWHADLGNGYYQNPILNADYSDPDAIRVGDDYYLTASSFEAVPGLPILHSKDLVNWAIIGHALKRQIPLEYFNTTRHGQGVWAPALRFHNNEYYLYYPDPDFGIYLVKAKNPAGPWSEPILVEGGKGLIDPCPYWDEDGKVYLCHAYAGSRAGIKSIIVMKRMNAEGTKVMDTGQLVYDGHESDPTIEGPKVYKRNGYYYIFAPGGGVATGWQLVLRSKNIYGPYERKVVMDQGYTTINGPHQGAWVQTQTGEDWFLHFQDKDAYGRVVHLQPMVWKNDWPVIGTDKDGDGKGEPVLQYKKPNVGKNYAITNPAESDEFNNNRLGLQWQWSANTKATWSFMNVASGSLRLYTDLVDSNSNLWSAPNVLSQKFPADTFTVTTVLKFRPNANLKNEKVGIAIMGLSYATLFLKSTAKGSIIGYGECLDADKGNPEKESFIDSVANGSIYMRIQVKKDAMCTFAYSTDGQHFQELPYSFKARPGKWIGAKIGIYATRTRQINDSGYADFDWVRVGH